MSNQATAGQTSDQKSIVAVMPDIHILASVTSFQEITDRIRGLASNVLNNFVQIGAELKKLRDDPKILTDCGYSDVYSYAEKVFGFQSTSAKNFIAVYEKFGDKDNTRPEISRKYDKYSISQLIELVPVAGDIDKFTPEMTVKEIRDTKALEQAKRDEQALKAYVRRAFEAALQPFLVNADVKPKASDGWREKAIEFSFEGTMIGKISATRTKEYKAAGTLIYNNGEFSSENLRLAGKGMYDYGPNKTVSKFAKQIKGDFEDKLKAIEEEKKQAPLKADPEDLKPEWLRWHEMTPAKKAQSVSKETINTDDDGLHQFFLTGSYGNGLVADFSSEDNDSFFPAGLVVLVSFDKLEADEPIRDDDKVLDVAFLKRDPLTGRLSLIPDHVADYIDEACEAKKKSIDVKEAGKKAAKAKKA
jgi:hypothetical protein